MALSLLKIVYFEDNDEGISISDIFFCKNQKKKKDVSKK